MRVQANVLNGGPDNRQVTGLRCEDIYLIGALPHIAEEAFDRIGRLNVSVHALASTRKTSTDALRPEPGFVPLPR
jgi:hypothetical protein